MGKKIKLTESQLVSIIQKVVNEQENTGTFSTLAIEWERFKNLFGGKGDWSAQSESVKKDFEKVVQTLKKGGYEADKAVRDLANKFSSWWNSWSFSDIFEDSDENYR